MLINYTTIEVSLCDKICIYPRICWNQTDDPWYDLLENFKKLRLMAYEVVMANSVT